MGGTNGEDRRGCLIVAEIGANHEQKYEKAIAMVRATAWAGADAVKVQLYTPEQMTLKRYTPEFRITEGLWAGMTLYELYEKAYMPHQWVPDLKKLAEELGLGFIASVYHPEMVETAEGYGIGTYKVASFEIFYEDLLKSLARTDKPVIVSCGLAGPSIIGKTVRMLGKKRTALLKCTSAYPAPLDRAHLLTIPDMQRRFGVPIGLSDHTTGIVCAVVAVSVGAAIIEKHFKIDENGFDAAFSADPAQFRTLVATVRAAEVARGQVSYEPTSMKYARREYEGKMVRTVN